MTVHGVSLRTFFNVMIARMGKRSPVVTGHQAVKSELRYIDLYLYFKIWGMRTYPNINLELSFSTLSKPIFVSEYSEIHFIAFCWDLQYLIRFAHFCTAPWWFFQAFFQFGFQLLHRYKLIFPRYKGFVFYHPFSVYFIVSRIYVFAIAMLYCISISMPPQNPFFAAWYSITATHGYDFLLCSLGVCISWGCISWVLERKRMETIPERIVQRVFTA